MPREFIHVLGRQVGPIELNGNAIEARVAARNFCFEVGGETTNLHGKSLPSNDERINSRGCVYHISHCTMRGSKASLLPSLAFPVFDWQHLAGSDVGEAGIFLW